MKIEIPEIYISFEPTLQCNMNCIYCYNTDNIYTTVDDNKFVFLFFLKRIKKVLEKGKTVEIDFLGGEPSLSNNIIYYLNEIIKLSNIYKNLILISLTTNGSIFLNNYEELLDKSKIKIEISYHNELDDLDMFINNIIKYKSLFDNVTVTFNLFKYKFDIDRINRVIDICETYDIETTGIVVYTNSNNNYFQQGVELLKRLKLSRSLFHDNFSPLRTYEDKLFEVKPNSKCRLISFNILFDGTISTSCGHKLFNKYNIKTDDIPVGEIITCNGTICEGSAGMNQRIAYEKEQNDS